MASLRFWFLVLVVTVEAVEWVLLVDAALLTCSAGEADGGDGGGWGGAVDEKETSFVAGSLPI